MPLSSPRTRQPIHQRDILCRGFKRDDGLWDIEARLTDTKSYPFPNQYRGEIKPGEPLHDMWLRLTLDDHLQVHDVEAVTDDSPFAICPAITARFKCLIGLSIQPGWQRQIRQLLGGVEGCTHLVELLGPLGTTAIQTIYSARHYENQTDAVLDRPPFLDTCHALASNSEVVKVHWPQFYDGPDAVKHQNESSEK